MCSGGQGQYAHNIMHTCTLSNTKDTNKLIMTKEYLIRGEYCLQTLAYVVSEITRNTFRDHNFQNWPEGAPQTPLIGVVTKIPSPTNPYKYSKVLIPP